MFLREFLQNDRPHIVSGDPSKADKNVIGGKTEEGNVDAFV